MNMRIHSCRLGLLADAVGDCVFVFFFGGLSREADVAGGLVMIGNCWMMAVFCVRSCMMCNLGVSRSVCAGDGGVISFSWQGGGRRTGVCLLVGLADEAGWRGHSPAEGAGCLLLLALFLYRLVGSTLWKVSSTRTRSFPSDILQSGEPTKVYSFNAFIKTVGSMVIPQESGVGRAGTLNFCLLHRLGLLLGFSILNFTLGVIRYFM